MSTEAADRAELAQAARHHRAGRLREAIAAYEQILSRAPADADVLQLLGLALGQSGRDADAARFLARSLELKPDRPLVLLNLAQALQRIGRIEDALRACNRALALDRSLAAGYRTRTALLTTLGNREEALANAGQAVRLAMQDAGAHADLGVALEAAGREWEALECFERAIALDPNLAEAHHNRALLLSRRGEHARALESFDRAIALQPHQVALHVNRGNTVRLLGRPAEAIQSYSLALGIDPRSEAALRGRAAVLYQLGRHGEALRDYDALAILGRKDAADLLGRGAALVALGRHAEALAPLEQAIRQLPGEAEAHVQQGVALLNLDRNSEAVRSFDAALALRPDIPEVLNNRGLALAALQRMPEALESFIRASVLDGANAATHTNIGITLKALSRYRESAASFDRALALRPGDPSTRFALAFLHLTLGDFELGWPLYESRFDVPELQNPPRRCAIPRWDGRTALAGRTLLVHAEQGLGDVIQFSRYLPLLVATGAEVIFEVMGSLRALMQTLPGVGSGIRLVSRGEPLPAADFVCPLLSLPLALGTRLETIPHQTPYLAAEPERVSRWASRLAGLDGLRIGIAWQGNLAVEKLIWARGRSVPLAALEPLARIPGISLVSLQKGPGREQLPGVPFADRIFDLGAEFDEGPDAFLDTAAVMQGLDLVISSDTAVAHLAGALARPVWTALTTSPEWRWLLDRKDSPWYPGMRLFRQARDGDWSTVIAEMAAELDAWRSQAPRSLYGSRGPG